MNKISNLSPPKILYNFSEDSCFKKITKIALIFFGMIAAEVLLTTLLYGITPISVFILGVLKINVICHMVKISIILSITTLFGFLEFFIFFAIFPFFKSKAKKNNENPSLPIENPSKKINFNEKTSSTDYVNDEKNNYHIPWSKNELLAYKNSFKNLWHSWRNQKKITRNLKTHSTNSIYCLAWLLYDEQGKKFMKQLFNNSIAKNKFIKSFYSGLIENLENGTIEDPMKLLNDFAKQVNKPIDILNPFFKKMEEAKKGKIDKKLIKKSYVYSSDIFIQKDLKELIEKICPNLK